MFFNCMIFLKKILKALMIPQIFGEDIENVINWHTKYGIFFRSYIFMLPVNKNI